MSAALKFRAQVVVPGTGSTFGYPVEVDGRRVGYVAKTRPAGWDGKPAVWSAYDDRGKYLGTADTRAKAVRRWSPDAEG